MNYTIVRPTIVLGKECPGWSALSRLAQLPFIPISGDGTARIQPIDVDDLVDAINLIVEEKDFCNEIFDLGGPETLSIEDFLKRVHRLYRGHEPKVIHLPHKALRWVIAGAERYLPRLMPLNAGQLSVFVEDGTIVSNRIFERQRSRMKDLDTILQALTANE